MTDPDLGESFIYEARSALARTGSGKGAEGTLRRAVSSAYYGIFHEFMQTSADIAVGRAKSRSHSSWNRVYRSIDHGSCRRECDEVRRNRSRYCTEICNFADAFLNLQKERIQADYDPGYDISKAAAEARVKEASAAISDLQRVASLGSSARNQLKEFIFLAIVKDRKD